MRRTRAVVLVVLSAIAVWALVVPVDPVAGCTLPIGDAGAAPGRLLFARTGGRGASVQAMDPDGTHVERIGPRYATDRHLEPGSARWSPDGSRVVWETHSWLRKEVHVADVLGGPATRLTRNSRQDNLVGWTADGESIVVGRAPGELALYEVRADGSGERRISPPGVEAYPGAEISSRGSVLFVESDDRASSKVFLLEPPWRRPELVTEFRYGLARLEASFSPDGLRFATGAVTVDIATGAQTLTKVSGGPSVDVVNGSPRWSPDGRLIALVTSREIKVGERFEYKSSIVLTGPYGGCSKRFDLPDDPTTPVWAPDGGRLAFSLSERNYGMNDIYLLDLETSRLTNVTETRGVDEVVSDWR